MGIKILLAVLLSAALIISAPHKQQHIHNSATAKPHHTSEPIKAVITQTAVTPVQPEPVAIPAPKPQVTETNYANGCSTYDSIFRQYAWNVSVAEAICFAESGGNPYAYSSTQDAGLMQIHDGLSLYGSQIYNPTFNISVAYQKYQSQGWEAWTTWNTGVYARYL